jgi:hypothetical protein
MPEPEEPEAGYEYEESPSEPEGYTFQKYV